MIIGALKKINPDDYKKYGYAGGEQIEDGVIKVKKVVEKPGTRENAPSELASISGFVITPEIYDHLEKARDNLSPKEELMYLSGMQSVIDQGGLVYAVELKNAIYRDTGNKLEYLKAVVEYGLKHEEIGEEFTAFLKDKASKV